MPPLGVGFVLALQYTAVGNVVILANSQDLLLLVGKIFGCQRILALEAAGGVVCLCGCRIVLDGLGKQELW
jgi:hypothetical protein